MTACQSENNVPWVGENQVTMGRDMGWIRLERYYEAVDASHAGPLDVRFLPMICQHCGNAPCEPVCPVFATYHTPDGINAQVYNRCVGTRYCLNNCPYKVRVFNWYTYTNEEPVREGPGTRSGASQLGVQPGCDGARERHHGEVLLLHPSYPQCAEPGGRRGKHPAGRRYHPGLSTELSGRGHRLRQHP